MLGEAGLRGFEGVGLGLGLGSGVALGVVMRRFWVRYGGAVMVTLSNGDFGCDGGGSVRP